ncbi:MAG: type II toxin-antitoxin system VapC family toxin [Cyanobacteria bacterium SZAS LIN-2]|nr:type II toxin-antitoxin system VapC family toxin [Cyanobacteria bacterium SZAS LIN-2]MBS2005845.1 type II toxin-antitoxin system VapC family toxin [Cyanobacteria bacterium SZAS TMP-1]
MSASVFLTDTHPLVYFITGQYRKIPRKVRTTFEDAVEGRKVIFIPGVVLWELSLLIKAGTVKSSISLEEYVSENFFARAISVIDICTADILQSHNLNFSRDPFDTLIVAMALRMDCPLITGDGVIHREKPCEVFW